MTLLYVLLLSLILPYLYSSSVSTSLLEHVLYSEDLMSAMYSPYFCCESRVANWFILEWYILSQNFCCSEMSKRPIRTRSLSLKCAELIH